MVDGFSPGPDGTVRWKVYARALGISRDRWICGGFDAVWLAEHHFHDLQRLSPRALLGVMAAARKRRASARQCRWPRSIIRCGSPRKWRCSACCRAAASVGRRAAALLHPEFAAFGVHRRESAERFRRSVEIVLQCWTQNVSPSRLLFRLRDIEVAAKPLQ